MRISVVMTAYNGSRYIKQQLDSVLTQSRVADEVIICDDCSSDDTYGLVKNYIEEHDLTGRWHVYENESNLGWRRNFYEAVKRATGDIIFFADQDDIWDRDKIKQMTYIMQKKGAGCVYGGAVEINGEGNRLMSRTGSVDYDGKCRQMKFSTAFSSMKTVGCRMCISRDVAELYLKLGCADFGHDSQCGILALLFAKFYVLDKPVIQYRVHQGNTSGISDDGVEGYSSLDFRCYDTGESVKMLRAILASEECKGRLSAERLKTVKKALEMQEMRLGYLTEGLFQGENVRTRDCGSDTACDDSCGIPLSRAARPVLWVSLWKYARYYSGIGMLVGDFAYKHKLNHFFGKVLHALKRLKNG